jgi:hypothetical protein
VYRLEGALFPGLITSGVALAATPDQVVMTLGDFRGDVWIMNVQRVDAEGSRSLTCVGSNSAARRGRSMDTWT